MKKLMFALAVAALAIGAQAATADWSYTITGATTKNAYGEVTNAGDATTLTAYLFDAAVWEGLTNVTADDLATKSLDSSAVKYKGSVGRGASATYQFATASDAGVGQLRDVSNDSWGATHDFYVVLVDNSKNPAEFTASAKQTLTTRGATDSPNTTGALPTTQTALSGATWGKVSSVPEPTSGLLMIVGLGALALRRRRA